MVGLAYGGAIMVEQMEQRKLSYGDGNLLNHHLAVCHSLLEDTIIFAAIGVPVLLGGAYPSVFRHRCGMDPPGIVVICTQER